MGYEGEWLIVSPARRCPRAFVPCPPPSDAPEISATTIYIVQDSRFFMRILWLAWLVSAALQGSTAQPLPYTNLISFF